MATKEQQIKNGFIYFLPMLSSIVLPLITLPIFTRFLTPEDYGILALSQIYAIFATGFANFGLTSTYERSFFQHKENVEAGQLMYSTLLFVIVNFFFIFGITYLFKENISRLIFGSHDHGYLICWAFSATFISLLPSYYFIYYKNSETASSFATYTILINIFNFFIALYCVAYLRIGMIGIIYAQFISGFIVFIYLSCQFLKILPVSLNKAILFDSLRISYPMMPKMFTGIIGSQFDKYMISLLSTLGAVGVYNIGQKISFMAFSFMTAIQNVYSPQVYKKMFELKDKGGEEIGKYITPFAYISIFIALMMALVAEEAISVLTPPPYHGAIDLVIIFSMYYGSLFPGKINGNQIMYTKMTFLSVIITTLNIVINVSLNIPFIMKWGMIGAAWATLIAGLIVNTIIFFICQHYYEVKWEYKKVGLMYAILFAASLVLILLRRFSMPYEVVLLFKFTALGLYLYLGYRVHIVTVENYNMIKRMLPFKKAPTI